MYFKVTENFDYNLNRYVYDICRETVVLHQGVAKGDVEKFVLDRASLHDSDLIEYSWGAALGIITGWEAREILSKKDSGYINLSCGHTYTLTSSGVAIGFNVKVP